MTTETLIVIGVLVVIAVVALGWFYSGRNRRTRLREKFGPEYERVVQDVGSEEKADALLDERARRVSKYRIRELKGDERSRFSDLWRRVQAKFVDDPAAAVTDADMLVTSAGVSRGDYDVVKDVLAKEGDVDFWTVRMRPGKPLAFGAFRSGDRRVPHLGLPGNPVSSMVSFELFGRPAIYRMLGRDDWERPVVYAVADESIVNTDRRRTYARPIVSTRDDGRPHAALTGAQGSGILTAMAAANALAVVPEDVPEIAAGEDVECMMIG